MTASTRSTIAQLALVGALRIVVSLAVLRLGFVAISDDDYARVTIAQAWAHAPRLDPSGTSWLPLPFWLHGSVMAIFGGTLHVARTATLAFAVIATCGLLMTIRAGGSSPRAAIAAAAAATLMPVSALTGVATVPELPTAVLCACALLMLRRRDRAALFAAASCALPASLSRYEAWPVAIVVAAAAWLDVRGNDPERRLFRPAHRALVSATALCGIVAWLAWNRIAHGDALHFHTRVASFWFATGHARSQAVAQLLGGYPWITVAGVPVLSTLVLGALWLVRDRSALRSWKRPFLGAGAVVIALTVMQATGGAPTHHAERTLMLVWMVAWAFVADTFDRAGAIERYRIGTLAAAAIVVALLGKQLTEAALHPETDRRGEERVGGWLHEHARGDSILLDPPDYGYFAVIASAGLPERFSLSHSIDPREAATRSPFDSEESLRARVVQSGAGWVVVRADRAKAVETVGTVEVQESGWVIARVR